MFLPASAIVASPPLPPPGFKRSPIIQYTHTHTHTHSRVPAARCTWRSPSIWSYSLINLWYRMMMRRTEFNSQGYWGSAGCVLLKTDSLLPHKHKNKPFKDEVNTPGVRRTSQVTEMNAPSQTKALLMRLATAVFSVNIKSIKCSVTAT